MRENTQKSKPVLKDVGISYVGIQDIRPCGEQPVYNMEVDQYHNFSVNGGVIVDNGRDETRYFAMTILRHKVGKEQYIPLYARR